MGAGHLLRSPVRHLHSGHDPQLRDGLLQERRPSLLGLNQEERSAGFPVRQCQSWQPAATAEVHDVARGSAGQGIEEGLSVGQVGLDRSRTNEPPPLSFGQDRA
jgi:hypothetical protein